MAFQGLKGGQMFTNIHRGDSHHQNLLGNNDQEYSMMEAASNSGCSSENKTFACDFWGFNSCSNLLVGLTAIAYSQDPKKAFLARLKNGDPKFWNPP